MSLSDRWQRLVRALRNDWREIGGLGRLSLVGVAAALALTVFLGFEITAAVRSHLLVARAELLENEVRALDFLVGLTRDDPAYVAYDELIRRELLGGETERVKLWSPTGVVLYSDRDAIVGQQFELSEHAVHALEGETAINTSNLDDAAHAVDRGLERLLEFYIPVFDEAGDVAAVFEIEQSVGSLDHAIGAISRNTWAVIGIGIAVLGIFMTTLAVARARDLNRRRRLAEQLLGRLFTAQEEERRRIVGALHDDIGQPLYRLLYGLEGSISRLGPASEVGGELASLQSLVRQVDGTLRSELASLSEHLPVDAGLDAALQQLAETTRDESALDVSLQVKGTETLNEVQRVALYRVAQEGVVNVRKHAEASKVSIEAGKKGGEFVVRIADDGRGSREPAGLGLTTSRERLEALGGWLELRSAPEEGSELVAVIPLREES